MIEKPAVVNGKFVGCQATSVVSEVTWNDILIIAQGCPLASAVTFTICRIKVDVDSFVSLVRMLLYWNDRFTLHSWALLLVLWHTRNAHIIAILSSFRNSLDPVFWIGRLLTLLLHLAAYHGSFLWLSLCWFRRAIVWVCSIITAHTFLCLAILRCVSTILMILVSDHFHFLVLRSCERLLLC